MTSLDHSASLTSAENVADYLLAGKRPEQLALITSKSQHSYGEIGRASSIVASRLIASGAEKQDRVLLIEENGLAWVSAYLGILRAGLICVPLPPGISAAELSYSIATVRPNFVIANRKVVSAQPGAFREIKLVSADVGNSDDAEHHVPWTSGGSDLAALMFTSGSTGKPRAVSVSHANIIANTESIISVLRLSSADRIMNVLPWH